MSGVETRGNKIRAALSVVFVVGLGGLLLMSNLEKKVDPGKIDFMPDAKPKIDRHEPAEVLGSRTTSLGGSRLVIRQCIDRGDCVTETYISKFPEASQVYPAGSTMELEDVVPPMRFVPGK